MNYIATWRNKSDNKMYYAKKMFKEPSDWFLWSAISIELNNGKLTDHPNYMFPVGHEMELQFDNLSEEN